MTIKMNQATAASGVTNRGVRSETPLPAHQRFRLMPEIGSFVVGGEYLSPQEAWEQRERDRDVVPMLYDSIRQDLLKISPVPINQVGIRKTGAVYVGVIDSYGVPITFALKAHKLIFKPAADSENAFLAMQEMLDEERQLSVDKMRKALIVSLDKSLSMKPSDSQGSKWFTDEHGDDWYCKSKHKMSVDRVACAHLAMMLYRLFGVRAPKTMITTVDGLPVLMSKRVPGNTEFRLDGLLGSDVRDGFVLDAWLGNWEVIGSDYDGVLVSGAKAYRIKSDASLVYDIENKRKEFGKEVHELDTMRNPEYPSGKVFGSLSDREVMAQILAFGTKYNSLKKEIDDTINTSGISSKLGSKIKKALHARASWLVGDGLSKLNRRRASSGASLHKADKIPGGLADKKKPSDFDKKQLAAGVKAELEHTSSKEIATEIAMDHLVEDPNYYKKLRRMEAKKGLIVDLERALPKKEPTSDVKQQKTSGASKKQAGAGGRTRYTYPDESKNDIKKKPAAGSDKPKEKPDAQAQQSDVPQDAPKHQPVQVPSEQHADPAKLAAQLGMDVSMLKKIADKFKDNPKMKGRSGFVSFMSTRLKEMVDKHKLTEDYFGLVYDALTQEAQNA